MSQSLFAVRLLLQQAAKPTVSASLSTLASSSSNTPSISSALSELSRHSSSTRQRLLSFNANDKNQNNNTLRDDAITGGIGGAFVGGIAAAAQKIREGGNLNDIVRDSFDGAVKGGFNGLTLGTVAGALRSNNPEDKVKVARAAAQGAFIGGGIGAVVGGVTVPFFVYIMTENAVWAVPAFFLGALLFGFSGARAGAMVSTAYTGFTATSTAPEYVQTFANVEHDAETASIYWDKIVTMEKKLSKEGFKTYLSSLDQTEFQKKLQELNTIKTACTQLKENIHLDVERQKAVITRLGKIDFLLDLIKPLDHASSKDHDSPESVGFKL